MKIFVFIWHEIVAFISHPVQYNSFYVLPQ